MNALSRREAVISVGAGACLVICGCQMTKPAEATTGSVDVGAVGDYPAGTVSDKFAQSQKLLIVRAADRIYATTAVCTHRGCTLAWKEQAIRCPCHGSVFDSEGRRTAGPAKAPLVRYAISLAGGRIIVDKTRNFQPDQWDDPATFVRVT